MSKGERDLFDISHPLPDGPVKVRTRLRPKRHARKIAAAMLTTFEARAVQAKTWTRVEPPREFATPSMESVF